MKGNVKRVKKKCAGMSSSSPFDGHKGTANAVINNGCFLFCERH